MKKLTGILERHLLPLAEKIQGNIYLNALKSGFIALMPYLIVGSFMVLLGNLPIPGYNEFLSGLIGESGLSKLSYYVDVTYGLMTLLVIITMSRELADKFSLGRSGSILPIVVFFLMFENHVSLESGEVVGGVFSLGNFGSGSMFLGIIISIISLCMLKYLEGKNITIKLPDSVPPEILKSFKSLVPMFIILTFWVFVKIGFEMSSYKTFAVFIDKVVQAPLVLVGGTLIAQILAELMISMLWFFGIHGDSVVSSIMGPVWKTLSAENLIHTQQGLEATNIISQQFRDVFLIAGGTGFTLALLVAIFIGARSSHLKGLAKLAAPAAIFNINEPIIFGVPVVLNPILLIPFVITPTVLCIITYFVTSIGLVPVTSGVEIPWTTPIFISGFLTTGIRGVILQLVNLTIATAIYLPFIKVLDKTYLMDEAKEMEEK